METLPRLTNISRLSTSPILQAQVRGNNGITLYLAVRVISRLNTYIRNFRRGFSFSYKGNNFEVVEAKEYQQGSIEKKMKRWMTISDERYDALESLPGPKSVETIAILNRYVGISDICAYLKERTPTCLSIILSKCEGKIQAVAAYSKDNSNICYLVSNPRNVKDPVNINPIAGGGTSIIAYLAQESLLQGTDLTLDAMPRSIPFYKRLQFEGDETEKGCPKFTLTAQKIRALIEQGIPPFDQLRTGTSSEV